MEELHERTGWKDRLRGLISETGLKDRLRGLIRRLVGKAG